MHLGQGQLLGQAVDLLRSAGRCGADGTTAASARASASPLRSEAPAAAAASAGSTVEAVERRVEAVDHDGAEAHADLVLEAERGLDQLVDRRLLGQGDQHDLGPPGVGEHLLHVDGLAC